MGKSICIEVVEEKQQLESTWTNWTEHSTEENMKKNVFICRVLWIESNFLF